MGSHKFEQTQATCLIFWGVIQNVCLNHWKRYLVYLHLDLAPVQRQDDVAYTGVYSLLLWFCEAEELYEARRVGNSEIVRVSKFPDGCLS